MEHLGQLPVSERLQLAQDLWDSIDESREQLPIHEWQRQLAQARLEAFEGREEELGLTRDQVWGRVDNRNGS